MASQARFSLRTRSRRLKSRPEEFSNFVRLVGQSNGKTIAAQFVDVSETGIQIISREPLNANVGDFIQLEFSLPGYDEHFQGAAEIVRAANEYTYAARFIEIDESQRDRLARSVNEYSRPSWYFVKIFSDFALWVKYHKTGLMISLLGLVLFSFCGLYIYSHSDEHLGRSLRPWGNSYPQQWDRDYVQKDIDSSNN